MCPYCDNKVSKASFGKIQEKIRTELEKKLNKEKSKLEKHQKALEKEKEKLDEVVEKRVADLLESGLEKAAKRDEKIIEDLEGELEEYIEMETSWEKEKREFERAKKRMEIEIEKASEKKVKGLLKEELEVMKGEFSIQLQEKDKIIETFKTKYEEAERKARGGSAQQKGLIQQHNITRVLQDCFRDDDIREIRSGVRGADIVQKVKDKSGTVCGTILWESKRANWSDKWISKLKNDKRKVNADIGIIVSETLPKGVEYLSSVDKDLVIMNNLFAVGLATIFRNSLIETKQQMLTIQQKESTMGNLFNYITDKAFIDKLKTIVESVHEEHKLMEKEIRSHETLWATRETLHRKTVAQVCMIYGDIKAQVRGLPEIKLLELPE